VSSNSLIKNTITRSGILILVKILGLLARIPLIRILGPEGIGLYQMAYAFYGFSLTMVSGGTPTSLALTTAETPSLGRRLFKRLAVLLLLLGVVAGAFCYRFSDALASSLGNPQLAYPIRCVAPAIAIVPFLGLVRSYLQGRNRHGLIAFSELIEQVIRLTLMLWLVFAWLPDGLPAAVGGAMIGAFAGAVCAIAFLLLSIRVLPGYNTLPDIVPQSSITKEVSVFLYSSLAVAATRFIVPFSDFLDAYLIPNRLEAAGFHLSEAVSTFGELAGMGSLVVYMPTLVTSALAYTLSTKLVADRIDNKNYSFQFRSEIALRFAWLWGIASSWFLFVYAEPLSILFFNNPSIAKAIQFLALTPILAGLRELTTIILWANGDKIRPFQGLVAAVAGMVLCYYTLIGIPGFGYKGAVIGLLSLELIAALWNSVMLRKKFRITFPFKRTLLDTAKLVACLVIADYSIRMLLDLVPFGDRWGIIQMIVVYSAGACYVATRIQKIRKQA